METVVGDISSGIQQFKNLSEVTLKDCSDELTRGVLKGLQRPKSFQYQVPLSTGELVTYSLVCLPITWKCVQMLCGVL